MLTQPTTLIVILNLPGQGPFPLGKDSYHVRQPVSWVQKTQFKQWSVDSPT